MTRHDETPGERSSSGHPSAPAVTTDAGVPSGCWQALAPDDAQSCSVDTVAAELCAGMTRRRPIGATSNAHSGRRQRATRLRCAPRSARTMHIISASCDFLQRRLVAVALAQQRLPAVDGESVRPLLEQIVQLLSSGAGRARVLERLDGSLVERVHDCLATRAVDLLGSIRARVTHLPSFTTEASPSRTNAGR